MQDDGVERRLYMRYPLRSRGKLFFNGNQPIHIRTLDISLGGICVVAETDIPAKALGLLEMNVPVGRGQFEMVNVNIQTMHSIFSNNEDGFKVGMLFLKPPNSLLIAIQKLFRS